MTSGSWLCMPSSLSLAIHSKIQANYYHLLTPKITNLYGSIWLFGFISCGISWWANKVCFALPFPFLLFLWNTCAHSTTTMAYINKKHIIVGPNSYNFNWFIPSFLYLHVIFFLLHLILERANVHLDSFFFFNLVSFCAASGSFICFGHRVIRCLPWVHLQNAISTRERKKSEYRERINQLRLSTHYLFVQIATLCANKMNGFKMTIALFFIHIHTKKGCISVHLLQKDSWKKWL